MLPLYVKVLEFFMTDKNGEKLEPFLDDKIQNPTYIKWHTNDGLLISWFLGTIKNEA